MSQVSSHVKYFTTDKVPTAYAGILPQVTLAYETFGQLNKAQDNAVLLIHSFSYSSHAAMHDAADTPGWWDWAMGPGRPLDTNKYFFVCSNNFGGCFGSTGPLTINPQDSTPFGRKFPSPTAADIVHCQRQLQQELGIKHWHTIIGGSLGGMAVLEWTATYPDDIGQAVCFHSGTRVSHTGQCISDLQAEIIRHAGDQGLSLAVRLSSALSVGEELFQQREAVDPQWRICDSLKQEAAAFVPRFNADTFLGFLNVVLSFDLHPENYPVATCATKPKLHLVGCLGDFLFPPSIIEETQARFDRFADVHKLIVQSRYAHDAFIIDEAVYGKMIAGFMA